MSRFIDRVLRFFFPARCAFCGRVTGMNGVCGDCEQDLPVIAEPTCMRCGSQVDFCTCITKDYFFDRNISAFYYEDLVKRAVWRLKFENRPQVAASCVPFAVAALTREISPEGFDVVTCVPMTAKRQRRRGYNQAELFAKQVARQIGKPYRRLLEKIRDNAVQSTLDAEERFQNVQGVYRAPGNLRGMSVLLCDDVMTTGATLSECAHMLKDAGACRVVCLTIAKTKTKTLQREFE